MFQNHQNVALFFSFGFLNFLFGVILPYETTELKSNQKNVSHNRKIASLRRITKEKTV